MARRFCDILLQLCIVVLIRLMRISETHRSGEAAFRGHTDVCEALERSRIAVPDDDDALRMNGGYTLCHVAAAAGHTHLLDWLLRHSESVASDLINNQENTEQLTALHCMILAGNFSVAGLEMLIGVGADTSAKCEYHYPCFC